MSKLFVQEWYYHKYNAFTNYSIWPNTTKCRFQSLIVHTSHFLGSVISQNGINLHCYRGGTTLDPWIWLLIFPCSFILFSCCLLLFYRVLTYLGLIFYQFENKWSGQFGNCTCHTQPILPQFGDLFCLCLNFGKKLNPNRSRVSQLGGSASSFHFGKWNFQGSVCRAAFSPNNKSFFLVPECRI